MPSPFPGMDPYLEDPALWPDFHHEFIAQLRTELNRMLRPRYFVRVELRIFMPDEEDVSVAIPDARISEWRLDQRPDEEGGVAVIDPPLTMISILEPKIEEAFLEIFAADLKKVVTVIELTSPGNKNPRSESGRLFRLKRREILDTPVNWVEIDLLRAGSRVGEWKHLPKHDYLVHASPATRRPKDNLWPFRVRDRFPVVGVPLLPEDADAAVNLGKVFAQSYENAAYDATIDYEKPAPLPLEPEDAAWAAELPRTKHKT